MTDQPTKPNEPGRQVGGEHYGGTEWQHWDWVEWNGLGYQEGQISLYVLRWRKKDGIKDLEKAIHHTEKLMEQYSDPRLMRRNRREYRRERKTAKLFNLMQTPAEESLIVLGLLRWLNLSDLQLIRERIIKLKETIT